jgi:hypothetical protein
MKKIIDKIFRDKDGKLVIAQTPNPPILIALVFLIASKLTEKPWSQYFSALVSLTLIYWAYLEVFKGASPWRRFLGVAVGLWSIYQLISTVINL